MTTPHLDAHPGLSVAAHKMPYMPDRTLDPSDIHVETVAHLLDHLDPHNVQLS